MKIWIDDIRQVPNGYVWCHSTNQAIMLLEANRAANKHNAAAFARELSLRAVNITPDELLTNVELVDIDHDAGIFEQDGGDYIRVLDFMEANEMAYPVRIHSMNPVGVQKMRAIIEHNGWREIK